MILDSNLGKITSRGENVWNNWFFPLKLWFYYEKIDLKENSVWAVYTTIVIMVYKFACWKIESIRVLSQ